MRFNRRQTFAALGATLAMPYVRPAWSQSKVVNVYNWADYIGETTLEDFESATGIGVVYDTYTSTEEMEAKILAGSTGYDVALMSARSMPQFITAGIFDMLDRSKLPSWGNLDPEVLRIIGGWDPDSAHGLPYMWGSVGIAYNLDMVKERLPDADLTNLDTVMKPENAEKLADCGISILDSPNDVVPMMLRYLGIDGDTTNVADYDKVVAALHKVRPYVRTFDNTNYMNAIPNGELCVINSWSGDYATARARAEEAGVKLNLGYYVPETGAPAWADMMSIPKDAPNKDNAYKFLEFLLQPEVMAGCTNYINYANANLASRAFVDKAVLDNPAVYPDEATMKHLWAPKALSDDQQRAITRAWTEIKTG